MRINRLTAHTRPSSSTRRRYSCALTTGAATLLATAALWLPAAASAGTVGGSLPATFWKGTTDGTWTGANWASDATGTATTAIPTAADDVTFSITGGTAHPVTTLGQDFTIHSLTVNDAAGLGINFFVGTPHTLTLSGNAGTGINVQSHATSVAIGANLAFSGSSDTIRVDNLEGLYISGAISGSNGLKKEGAGTLTLAGANMYSGGTIVNEGTLVIDNMGSVQGSLSHGTLGSGTTTVNGGSVFRQPGGALNFVNVATAGSGVFFSNGATAVSTDVFGYRPGGTISFFDSTTAATGTYTINGGISGGQGGAINFHNISTAADGNFTINVGSSTNADGGSMTFSDNATAGSGKFLVNRATASSAADGRVLFSDVATAGSAHFAVNGNLHFDGSSSAGTGTFTGNGGSVARPNDGFNVVGSVIGFSDHATAANSTIMANGGTAANAGGALVNFDITASAGSATITANGGTSSNAYGGSVNFDRRASAGNATLTANGGTNGGAGGRIRFSGLATGTNGAVTLNGNGSLDISGSANGGVSVGSLSGDGNVSLGSKNLTVGSNNQSTTFSGVIQDGGLAGGTGGSLTKTGTGTLTLGGTNTYTGATTVKSGALVAGSTQAFGINSAVTIEAGAKLVLDGFSNTIGSLSGGGNVDMIYPIFPGGALTVGGSNTDATFSGSLASFRLSLVKVGDGTQILSGINTYAGGTTLKQGTLAAGNASAFGFGGLTMTGGTLRTDGGPRLIKLSYFTMNSAERPAFGPYTVVNNGGSIFYSQSAGGNILFTGGTFQATVGGTSPGVTHDQIATGGTADINGATVALVQLGNYHLHVGDKVVLISAEGGVYGGTAGGTQLPADKVTGGSTLSTSLLLVPVVNLYETSVVLELMQGSFMALAHALAFSPNQTAVAGALDDLIAKSRGKIGAYPEVDFFNSLPPGAIGANLDMLTPEALTSIFNLSTALANVQTANIQNHLADIRAAAGDVTPVNSVNVSVGSDKDGANGPKGARTKVAELAPEERWGFFMTGSGEFTHIGGLANGAGINLDTGGVTAGVDYRFTEHFAAGISLGYMNTTAGLANGGGVDVHGGRIGAYATWFNGGLHFDATVPGGFNSYFTRRATPGNTAATASPEGSEVSFLFAAGRDWTWKGLTIGPTASVQYTHTHLDGFTERGPFAPLRVAAQDSESLRSALGIRASFEKKVGRRTIRPEVRAAWQHEYGDVSHSLTSSFATLGGVPFTVTGPATGRDSLLLGAGFTVQWNDRFATYAFYDGELARTNYRSNSVSVGFRYQF